jgi:hypothetical protein
MTVIPIEPFWEKLVEHHKQHHIDEDFWNWLKREHNAYQVYIVSNPTQVGEQKGSGLMFGDPEDATLFALKWT